MKELCERCGHDADNHHNGKDCLWDNAEGEDDLIVCRCESYRPPTTEPESDGKPLPTELCGNCGHDYETGRCDDPTNAYRPNRQRGEKQ